MIPPILSETLATLQAWDSNGDWHLPDPPEGEDSGILYLWAEYFSAMGSLCHDAGESLLIAKTRQRAM